MSESTSIVFDREELQENNEKLNKRGGYERNSLILTQCEQIADKAIDLIFNNKINAKNAFDVNVEFLENLPRLLNKNEESAWQKASASLDASAKIYGYRVDSVHSDTFRVLSSLSRTDMKHEVEIDKTEAVIEIASQKNMGIGDGSITLEKDKSKIDLVKYDLEFDVDPLFKNMTARFNDSGARGLLLNTLPINKNLNILLESNTEEEKMDTSKKLEINNEKISELINCNFSSNFDELNKLLVCQDLSRFKNNCSNDKELEKSLCDLLESNTNEFTSEIIITDNNRTNSYPNSTIERSVQKITLVSDNYQDSKNLIYNHNEEEKIEMFSYEVNDIVTFKNIPNYIKSESDDLFAESGESKNFSKINFESRDNEMKKLYNDFDFLRSEPLRVGSGNKEFKDAFHKFKRAIKNENIDDSQNNNKKINKKKNKFQELFNFDETEQIDKNEIFFKKEVNSKKINSLKIEEKTLFPRKKIKNNLFLDKHMLTTLFMIPERKYITNSICTTNVNETDDDLGSQNHFNQEMDFETRNNINIENSAVVDKEYEKMFGRLYKTFDVRYLKSKIWDSINTNINGVNFNKVLEGVSKSIPNEVKKNISPQTCFVCLLHLANEKVLKLEEDGESEFLINLVENSS